MDGFPAVKRLGEETTQDKEGEAEEEEEEEEEEEGEKEEDGGTGEDDDGGTGEEEEERGVLAGSTKATVSVRLVGSQGRCSFMHTVHLSPTSAKLTPSRCWRATCMTPEDRVKTFAFIMRSLYKRARTRSIGTGPESSTGKGVRRMEEKAGSESERSTRAPAKKETEVSNERLRRDHDD